MWFIICFKYPIKNKKNLKSRKLYYILIKEEPTKLRTISGYKPIRNVKKPKGAKMKNSRLSRSLKNTIEFKSIFQITSVKKKRLQAEIGNAQSFCKSKLRKSNEKSQCFQNYLYNSVYFIYSILSKIYT